MCQACEDDPDLEAYYHGCSYCGVIPDDDGECNCPPEGYVKPGRESLLYVNAYEVTRHYGGPEEGGWYYNHHEPIASIPVKAISIKGHSDACYTCSQAREGNGEYELCKWGYQLKAIDPVQVDMLKRHLENLFSDRVDGDIYSVLGGIDIMITVEDHIAKSDPIPHYE